MKNFDLSHTFYRDGSTCTFTLLDDNGRELYDATKDNVSVEEAETTEQKMQSLERVDEAITLLKHDGFTIEEFKW